MAYSKVILNGTTLIDVTQKTVSADKLLNGYTALKNDGTDITGEYVPSTAVLQTKSETYTPTTSQQSATITADGGYDGLSSVSVTVNAMPSGSASTPATSITANPTISVSASGLITASVSGSQSVTPSVSAGYIASGTAGTVTVSGSNTQQLTTQSAQTITPTTTNQTIASGKYLTGTQTVLGDANLLAENIKKDVVLFGITGTYEGSGGSVNKVLLYTQSGFDNLYVDSSCTVSLLESCDYDYHAAFDVLLNADVIVIQIKNSNHYYFPTRIYADFADDSVEVDLRNPVNGMDIRIYAY